MKKFLKTLFSILIVLIIGLILLLASFKIYGDKILCFCADKYFEWKDFPTAYVMYDAINTYKPNNSEYSYKLTKCLTKMPMTYSVQKKLVDIAQKDDGSEAEKLATDVLIKFRKKIYKKFGDTYIQDALNEGLVLRWSKKSFPLTYYVDMPSDVPEYYLKETIGAFDDWQRESEEFVKFKRVNNAATAKIVVRFKGNAKESSGETQYKAAITTPLIENDNILKQMRIISIIKNHTGDYFTPQQVKTIMAHEIGHALGIWGHSSDNKTIMYFSLDNPYDYYEKRIDTSLNSKDISTIKLLYIFAPNITDNTEDFQQKERFIYPPSLLSPVDNNKEKAVARAKEMLINHPENMGAALSLADAYNADGKFVESIELMKFLTEQTLDKNLLNLLYYNIANNYISLKDFQNALLYAKLALKCSNNLENKTLIAYIKYCSGDLENAEKEFIAILSKNPAFTSAALGLADVYIKQKKYVTARKVLKELVKYNPEALNDKSLNSYKLLTMF